MLDGDEKREPFRFAEDDDSDDLGGFSRGKRSYEDEEDEENGGWAINEDHSDRLWDSAEDVDDDDDEETRTATDADEVEDDDEEEADLFGGGAPRGRRGRPKGSTNANREKAALSSGGAREPASVFGATSGSLFDDADDGASAPNAGGTSAGASSGSRSSVSASAASTTSASSRSAMAKKPAIAKSGGKKSSPFSGWTPSRRPGP